MANFILLCLERQEYLFIAVKQNEAGEEKNKKQTKLFTNKPGNQTFRIM